MGVEDSVLESVSLSPEVLPLEPVSMQSSLSEDELTSLSVKVDTRGKPERGDLLATDKLGLGEQVLSTLNSSINL